MLQIFLRYVVCNKNLVFSTPIWPIESTTGPAGPPFRRTIWSSPLKSMAEVEIWLAGANVGIDELAAKRNAAPG
jgi:hypothetical protein